MAGNHFGTLFKIVTWGESHGKAIGVVIDGCPAGLPLSAEEINEELAMRRPGQSPLTSARHEEDRAEVLSGLFEGKTTGAPISIIIQNTDALPSDYKSLREVLRPGHANFTYLKKYGHFDWRGSGRASARETACRVAAGAVAKKLLKHFDITMEGSLHTPDQAAVEAAQADSDSVGGVVALVTAPLPIGLGEPLFDRLEANLAKAMLSIPASKGVEFGLGFAAATKKGSEHNDLFVMEEGSVVTKTNHSGGTLGGISNGMPLVLRVAFKPTSSIGKEQETLTTSGKKTTMTLPKKRRYDPCVAIRAVPVVEAMAALVLADHLLLHRTAKL